VKSDLRNNPQRSMGRYWLTMSDASAFTLVRSSVTLAEALRRDLAEKLKVVAEPSPVEIATVLLTAAEAGWGKGKANQLISQIIGSHKPDTEQRGGICLFLRDTLAQLPLTLWPQDKLPARRELLEELARQVSLAHADVPTLPTRDEIREQEWRDQIAGLRREAQRHA
jgi:hypothetical protein